jgi:N12 class adenine-specific DNA methylase
MNISWIDFDKHNVQTGESIVSKIQSINNRPFAILYNVGDTNLIRNFALEKAGFKLSSQNIWLSPIDQMNLENLKFAFPLMEFQSTVTPINKVIEPEENSPNSFLSILFNNTTDIDYVPDIPVKQYKGFLPPAGEVLYDWVKFNATEITPNVFEAPYTKDTNITLSFDKNSRIVDAIFHQKTFHLDIDATFTTERNGITTDIGDPFIHSGNVFIQVSHNMFAPAIFKNDKVIALSSFAQPSPQHVLRSMDRDTANSIMLESEFIDLQKSLNIETSDKEIFESEEIYTPDNIEQTSNYFSFSDSVAIVNDLVSSGIIQTTQADIAERELEETETIATDTPVQADIAERELEETETIVTDTPVQADIAELVLEETETIVTDTPVQADIAELVLEETKEIVTSVQADISKPEEEESLKATARVLSFPKVTNKFDVEVDSDRITAEMSKLYTSHYIAIKTVRVLQDNPNSQNTLQLAKAKRELEKSYISLAEHTETNVDIASLKSYEDEFYKLSEDMLLDKGDQGLNLISDFVAELKEKQNAIIQPQPLTDSEDIPLTDDLIEQYKTSSSISSFKWNIRHTHNLSEKGAEDLYERVILRIDNARNKKTRESDTFQNGLKLLAALDDFTEQEKNGTDWIGQAKIGLTKLTIQIPVKKDVYQIPISVSTQTTRYGSKKFDHFDLYTNDFSSENIAQLVSQIKEITEPFVTQVIVSKLPAYGSKLNTGKNGGRIYDVSEINKRIREDIKVLTKEKIIPKGLKLSIKKDHHSSMTITIKEIPNSISMITPEFAQWRLENPTEYRSDSPTEQTIEYLALYHAVEATAEAYNYDNSDMMTDYHDTNFYLTVSVDSALYNTELEKSILAYKQTLLSNVNETTNRDTSNVEFNLLQNSLIANADILNKIETLMALASEIEDTATKKRLETILEKFKTQSVSISDRAIINNIELALKDVVKTKISMKDNLLTNTNNLSLFLEESPKEETLNINPEILNNRILENDRPNTDNRVIEPRSNDARTVNSTGQENTRDREPAPALLGGKQSNDFQETGYSDEGVRLVSSRTEKEQFPEDSRILESEAALPNGNINTDDSVSFIEKNSRVLDLFPRDTLINMSSASNEKIITDFSNALELYSELLTDERALTVDEKHVLASLAGSSHPLISESLNSPERFRGNILKTSAFSFKIKHPEQFKRLAASTVDAYYTPVDVVEFMWGALHKLGINSKLRALNVFEPSIATGRFIGLAPDGIRATANITGVEKDNFSSDITRLIYPEVNVLNSPLEDLLLINGTQDIVIGNPPYGDFSVYDSEDKKLRLVHDYFLKKSIDLLKPGGVLAFVTSKGTLDKSNGSIRSKVALSSDLVSAFRLPSSTFSESGTNVVTDVLFFRKRHPEEEPSNLNWVNTASIAVLDESTGQTEFADINQYYIENPNHIIGDLEWISSQYGRKISVRGSINEEVLNNLIEKIPENVFTALENNVQSIIEKPKAGFGFSKIGSYIAIDDSIFINGSDGLIPHTLNSKKSDKLHKIIKIRDTLLTLLDIESNDNPVNSDSTRALLNSLYDDFVTDHGFINAKTNKNLLKLDPDQYLTLALELKDGDQGLYVKSDVFSKSFQQIQTNEASLDTVLDVALFSLNKKGFVDTDLICETLDLTSNEVKSGLHDNFFIDPINGKWVLNAIYLSGNIYEKLAIANKGLKFQPEYQRNIDALTDSIPETINIEDINIRIGSAWVPKDIVLSFLYKKLGARITEDRIRLNYEPKTHHWNVELTGAARRDFLNTNERDLGAGGLRYDEIFSRTLNYKQITIHKSNNPKITPSELTSLARSRQVEIVREFQDFVLSHSAYSKAVTESYNKTFNGYKEAEYDGSYMSFPGMSNVFNGKPLALRHHQPAIVERILHSDTGVLIGHEAGAGKTIEMIASAIEMRRLNQAKRPLMVMPNHMLLDATIESFNLYPNARILTATPNDFSEEGRQLFAAKVRLNEWDLIICTQSMFASMYVPHEFLVNHIEDQIEEFSLALSASNDKITIKTLEKAKNKLEAKLKLLTDKVVNSQDKVSFEDCGFDCVFYDEGHYLKNFAPPTSLSNVSGVNSGTSIRAMDAVIKSDYIRHIRQDNKGFNLATATPITNSVAEIWVMLRLTAPSVLIETGIHNFDNFVSTFGEIVDHIELKPEGGSYQLKSRLSKFHNVPELIRLFRIVADIKTASDLNLPTPKANDLTHVAPQSKEMVLFMDWLSYRANKIRKREVEPTEDNILKIANDGRMASLDMRLIHPDLPDFPDSKINHAVKLVYDKYIEHAEDRRTQVIFSDRGTPKQQFNIYDDMKEKWVKLGVPEGEIQFVHDAKNDSQKAALFKQMREGEVRILLGSTDKLGVGTNIQSRGSDLYNLDIPWRPTDLIQRRKRFERQGNIFDDVNIHFSTTEDSFDMFMLETNIRKLKFITQALSSPDQAARQLDEDVDPTLAEIMAITSGNPLIKEKVEIDTKAQQLLLLKRSHDSKCRQNLGEASYITSRQLPIFIEQRNQFITSMELMGDNPKFTVNGHTYSDLKVAGKAILEVVKSQFGAGNEVAKINGVSVMSRVAADRYFLEVKTPIPIEVNLTKDPARFTNNILVKIAALDKGKAANETRIREYETRLEKATANADIPYPDEAELNKCLLRQTELNAAVAKIDDEKPIVDHSVEHEFETLISTLEAKRNLLSDDDMDLYINAITDQKNSTSLGIEI